MLTFFSFQSLKPAFLVNSHLTNDLGTRKLSPVSESNIPADNSVKSERTALSHGSQFGQFPLLSLKPVKRLSRHHKNKTTAAVNVIKFYRTGH